jgi:hypothetical protein
MRQKIYPGTTQAEQKPKFFRRKNLPLDRDKIYSRVELVCRDTLMANRRH